MKFSCEKCMDCTSSWNVGEDVVNVYKDLVNDKLTWRKENIEFWRWRM